MLFPGKRPFTLIATEGIRYRLVRHLSISIRGEAGIFKIPTDKVDSITDVGIALTIVSVHTYSIGREF